MKGCICEDREQEGKSSSGPELAALEVALRQAGENEAVLYFCNNQSVLTEVGGWIGKRQSYISDRAERGHHARGAVHAKGTH